ncbi:MAG: Fe-Mn family superoxide dismutase [bacterium]|nr:Fe-Mn family superoxide dismutase [bacterium]
MPFTVKDLPYPANKLAGISEKTTTIHHDKLYAGYVNKRNEIEELLKTADRNKAAATFSEYRELKLEETFNADGIILHELYFATMGGDGTWKEENAFVKKATEDFGSFETFLQDLKACGIAARGWAVTAYDQTDGSIHNFLGDSHNHGGVWGATPVLALDAYEHAYFMDFGSDRKAYVEAWIKNVDWAKVESFFTAVPGI